MIPSRILDATDGSPAAKEAETYAAEIANAVHASNLTVVTVLRTCLDPMAGRMEPTIAQEKAAQELVDEAAEHVRGILGNDSVPVDTKVLKSLSEARGIIEEAHATGTCSQIVMGNRGHGGISSLLLGSTSHHVVEAAHCPVTIVRL